VVEGEDVTAAADGDASRPDAPRALGPRPRLETLERRRVLGWAALPVVLAVVVLAPFAVTGRASVGDVLGAALVYGGLLGLAAGFVAVDRAHARMCPGCGTRNAAGTPRCPGCGYDLVERPRYVCEERHTVHLEPGLCACGRRLQRLPAVRGIGPEVVFVLKVGGWLLAFLVGVGLLLRVTGA
jgi:hypothetical protein